MEVSSYPEPIAVVPSEAARRAAQSRDLASTKCGLSWREGPSTRPFGPWSGRRSLVPARDPGQAAELDALIGQRVGLLVAGLAIDAALVALAVVDLARLIGELVADMLAVLLDLLAHLEQGFAQLLRHVPGHGCHLLLLRRGSWRRSGSGRHFDVRLLAAFAEARRHQGTRDLGVAAHGAADQGLLFLAFVGLAVLEPAFELVAFGAAQSI